MILWDALPVGATAELTFSGVDADAVLGLAALRGGPDVLQLSADGALECTVGGVTYVPLPSDDEPVPGLLSVTLPPASAAASNTRCSSAMSAAARGGSSAASPCRSPSAPHASCWPARRTRSRCSAIFSRRSSPRIAGRRCSGAYVQQVARRVDAFGGVAEAISASPDGAPVRRRRWCAWVLAALPALGWLAWRWLRRERRPRRHLRRLH